MVDIAKAANVSIATVSMALRGHPRISDATKERVRQICIEKGFVPDPAATALASKKLENQKKHFLGTIAVLESEKYMAGNAPCESILSNNDLAEIFQNIGYKLDAFSVGKTANEQRALNRTLQARGIRGLFIWGRNEPVHTWAFDWENFSVIVFSGSLHEHVFHNVIINAYQHVYDAVLHLYSCGYKKPAYLELSLSKMRFDAWTAGFTAAVDSVGNDPGIPVFSTPGLITKKNEKTRFVKWINRYTPDVIVSQLGDPLIEILSEENIRVPQDIGIFCLDVMPDLRHISGLIQQRHAGHQAAFDLLHGMLSRNESGLPGNPMCIQIAPRWNEGTTVLFNALE